MILAGVILLTYSCASPSDPTATEMAPGEWEVVEYYVNGQSDGSYSIWDRFILERDGTFVLEDQNELFFGGTWTITDTTLTLTADDGTTFTFAIVFMSYTKMQLVQTITNPNAGDIEIRYLMNRDGNSDYYDNTGN